MKVLLLLPLMIIATQVESNGLYHQEYNYKASSASYRNNELQHKNDDEGFYSRDGDLEGRLKPKVNSHDQHSEYVNPKLKYGGGYATGTGGGYASGTGGLYGQSSYGQMNTQDQMYGGMASSGGASYSGGESYPQQSSYGVNSNLRQLLTQQLQTEMAREMQMAIEEQCRRSLQIHNNVINQAQIDADIRYLEEILRRNISSRIDDVLRSQYGEQGIRDSQSYSIINGRLQSTPNYHSRELEDLRRQIEVDLVRRLQEGVRTHYQTYTTTSHHTSSTTHHQQQQINGGINQGYVQPSYPSIVHRPVPLPIMVQEKPYYGPVIANPDSLTTIATRVQNDLNTHVDKILEDTQRRYFSTNSQFTHQNFDLILQDLQQELRANITVMFQQQLRYNQHSGNFNADDLANLKGQIERNLIEKLTRSFNTQRENYQRTVNVIQGSSSFQHHGGMNNFQTVGNQQYYPQPIVNYHQVDWQNMQQRLQEDLSRQLESALRKQQYRQDQMSYQASLQQLNAEMQRNLTQQMENRLSQYEGASHSSGYNSQMANMRNQLQNDLYRQLQQGLQQTQSRYSSWSSSSSSSSHNGNSNYRPVRGYDSTVYQPYTSVNPGEDCMMGDDPSAYTPQRDVEDLSQQSQDLTQQLEDADSTLEDQHPSQTQHQMERLEDLGQQQLEDDDLSQRPQSEDLTQQLQDFGQQSEDLTQQVEDQHLSQFPSQAEDLTQQVDNQQLTNQDDLTQQPEDFSQHQQQPESVSQQNKPQQVEQVRPQVVQVKRYFITDSSGRRIEVDQAQFEQHMQNVRPGGSSTSRYFVGQDEIKPGQYWQSHTTTTHHQTTSHHTSSSTSSNPSHFTTQTPRKYYITDSTGIRTEVTEEEFNRRIQLLQSNPGQTTITTKYYVNEEGVYREINPQTWTTTTTSSSSFVNHLPSTSSSQHTTQISRKYYITDSNGVRREVDEAEYLRQMQLMNQGVSGSLHQIPSDSQVTTHVTRKYYVTDSSGIRREVTEAEFNRQMELVKTGQQSITTHKYFVSQGSSNSDVEEVSPSQYWQLGGQIPSSSSHTIHVTRKFYITDSSGVRRVVTEAEFNRQMELMKTGQQSITTHKYFVSQGSNSDVEVSPAQYWQQIPSSSSHTTHITRKYYITDSSGIRKEVTQAEFQREIESMNEQTTITRHYYVTDITTGNTVQVRNPDQYWHLVQQQQNQAVPLQTITQVRRRFFITDDSGVRKEVTGQEFRRHMFNIKMLQVGGSSYVPTRKYYFSDSTTNGYIQEITPQDYWRHQELYQPEVDSTTTVQINRQYYITDSSGHRKEVTEAEFREYLAKTETSSSTSTITRHYYIRENGVLRELRPDEFEKYEQQSGNHLQQPLDQVVDDNQGLTQQTEDFGQQVEDLGPQEPLGQVVDDNDNLTQQTEDFNIPQNNNQQQIEDFRPQKPLGKPLAQQIDDSDLSQQPQQIDNEDLTQQVQQPNWQIPSEELNQQQVDELTPQKPQQQQQQEIDFGKPVGQQIDDSDLTQQTEDFSFNQQPIEPQIANQNQQRPIQTSQNLEEFSQQPDQDLNQQVVEDSYPSQQSQSDYQDALAKQQALIDKLRELNKQQHLQQQQQQNIGSMHYQPKPVFANINENQDFGPKPIYHQVGTTRDGPVDGQQQIDLGQQEEESDLSQHPIKQQYNSGTYSRPTSSYSQQPQSPYSSRPYGSPSYGSVQSGRSLVNSPRNAYGPVHYGSPKYANEQVETAPEFEEVQPLKQHATEVESVKSADDSVSGPVQEGQVVETDQEEKTETPEVIITTPAPGFWGRVGNNIKDKAKKLKSKFV